MPIFEGVVTQKFNSKKGTPCIKMETKSTGGFGHRSTTISVSGHEAEFEEGKSYKVEADVSMAFFSKFVK